MTSHTNAPLSLHYDALGQRENPALVLIPGLGSQSISWSLRFCGLLAEAGFYVLRLDNRDCGLSAKLTDAPTPSLQALFQGQATDIPYNLLDMAADVALTLDNAGISQAHIIGRSMGGMIAQLFAAQYPQRTASLSVVMSSSGNPALPPADSDVMALLMAPKPDPATRTADYIEQQLSFLQRIASVDLPFNRQHYVELLQETLLRDYSPAGTIRQIAAIAATGDLRRYLSQITAPTLVIHGSADPLFLPQAGKDIGLNITGSTVEIIEGMGHDLPPERETDIAALLLMHLYQAEHSAY